MGMTYHFIDEETFVRHSYVLGCKRIKGSHNYQNIAEVISKITQIYNIEHSKITHIITDNAANFGKAFRVSVTSNSDSGSDCSNFDLENVEFNDLFLTAESNTKNDSTLCLPRHMLCCAYTLNLIAASDISKISDNNYNKISKSTFTKLTNFWNLASRSTAASDKKYDICKCKFPVPVVTRWNSLCDATQKILVHKMNIRIIFEQLHLPKLKNNEWGLINEYCKVMKPLAFSLDKLQGETKSFLGYVAPTILVLRKLLILNQSEQLMYCKPLSLTIINSLKKRFNFLFYLNDSKSKDFIIASINHPKFKLDWVPVRYKDLCKKIFIEECNSMSPDSANEESDCTSDKEFYDNLYSHHSINDSSECYSNGIDLSQENESNVQEQELDLLNNYPVIKKVFIKYNTTLPSSAPVERPFSDAVQVLISRRNRL
ncbi:hypothetical protein AGLY_011497, partial [Aphis glycines]